MSTSTLDFKQALAEIQATASNTILPLKRRLDALEANASRPTGGYESGGDPSHDRIAKSVWGASAFQEFQKTGKGRIVFPVADGFFPEECKTTITSSAVGSSTPGILTPERVAGVWKPGVRAFRIRDLIPRYPTRNNAVDYITESAFTNAASPTAETISKPESAITFAIDSANVRTLAHWLPTAKQVMDDFAELRGFLDVRLIEGLKDVEDYELLGGDGTGQHLSGLGLSATAYDTARNAAGDTQLDKIAHAFCQLWESNRTPSGLILHPRDWQNVLLLKQETGGSNTGAYIMGPPNTMAPPFVWGVPVATSTAVVQGTFYCGDFTQCAIFDRQEAIVEISDSHADYWVRNMLAVRCEERLAFAIFRGDAFLTGSL